MIRKFNYTNRIKIPRENISISIQKNEQKVSFTAIIRTSNLKFPDDAKVYIEPYYGGNYLRFNFGTIGNIEQPVDLDITELKQFSEKIYFRIKVVNESNGEGLLLGFADKLPLADEDGTSNKSSILFVNPVIMETNEVWRVNFDADPEGMPVLEVNNSIEGIKEIARSDPRFIAMVFPATIRLILGRITKEESFGRDDTSWAAKWIQFTEDVLGITNTPADSESVLVMPKTS